jgi:hypothetical protein
MALLASACPDADQLASPPAASEVNDDAGAQAETADELEHEHEHEANDAGVVADAADDEADAGEEAADAAPDAVDAGQEAADAAHESSDAGAGSDAATSGDAAMSDSELPCEIRDLLKMHCQGCHSAQSKTGVSLMTYANLMAPTKSDPTIVVWKRALERMSSSDRPMPPSGKGTPVSADEVAAFAAWVDQGVPAEQCEE